MLLAGHYVGVVERQQERFEGQGAVVVQELAADAEQAGGGGDAANLVQELPGRLDAHAEVVQVFLHLLHLGRFARGGRTDRLVKRAHIGQHIARRAG